jgi:hypothetical protein
MKKFILTHKQSSKQQIMTEEQLRKLRGAIPVARIYNVEEVPDKRSVPKPAELDQETPEPVKGVKKPKAEKDD